MCKKFKIGIFRLIGIHFELSQNEYFGELELRGPFNKFPDFFVQALKIVVDSWKFTMWLLYILWDDSPIFMISSSKEQL